MFYFTSLKLLTTHFSWFLARTTALLFVFLLSTTWAAPVINNNAGTWTDPYTDSLGVASVVQTEVHATSGVVRLEAGETSGQFRTVNIKPNSFSAWGALTLDASYSASGDVQIEVLDPLNADAVLLGPVPYHPGPLDLSGLDAVTYPELRFRVTLTEGGTRPTVSAMSVSWTPESGLLLNKKAPAEVQAGDNFTYRLNYSVAFVAASNLVVYDSLTAMTYPANFGQDDNLTFVSANKGGQFTASAITVKGVAVPANSVYWDLGNVAEGTTDVLLFTVKSKNGTLNGSVQANAASADAANADPVVSPNVQTVIRSSPSPRIQKRSSTGIYGLSDGHYTNPGTLNRFHITVQNDSTGTGNETMYETVVFDNLNDLTGKINPNLGGAGIPVSSISPAGGQYTATAVTVSGTAVPANSVYWNVGTLAVNTAFSGQFSVELLSAPPLASPGQYTNVATLDSFRTTPLTSSLTVKYPLDETASGLFAKGDGISGTFSINAGRDDNSAFYVKPGEVAPFALMVRNNGLVALNDVVFLDRVPTDTTFKSAWFSDPWLQANARIFYSTTDTANADTPHAYDVTQAPADLDPAGNTNWQDYAANPPADPSAVRWVAYWIPGVNSTFFDSTTPGWITDAPRQAIGYFDVFVSSTLLEPTPCVDKSISNRGLFRIHAATPLAGGGKVSLPSPIAVTDNEPVRISTDKPLLAFTASGSLSPQILDEPGPVQFTTTVSNNGKAVAQNVQIAFTWPKVPINGVPQYLSLNGVNRPISSFDPINGTVTVDMGNLVPGASLSATLTVQVPAGVTFGQQLPFTARASAAPAPCSVTEAVTSATANTRFLPMLRVFKNDVVDLIPSSGFIDYTLTARNLGSAPSTQTWIVDRIPNETTFVSASAPQGEKVWFSQTDNLPPSFLSPLQPLDATFIATHFAPGIRDDNGTPTNFTDDTWTSPFGNQTRWVAWLMDDASLMPQMFPVGDIRTVGFRVVNDIDGPGPGTAGSLSGVQIFNSAGIFSDELIQAVGNEVVSTIQNAPGILVEKTGPSVVSSGQQFNWTISYYNNSGAANDSTFITETLPANVSFVSATHVWNAAALANGAPTDNNSQVVPSSVTANPNGTTTLVFQIANDLGSDGYRGNNAELRSLEGGTLTLTVQADSSLPTGSSLINHVSGTASNEFGTTVSRDQHETIIRNADVRIGKFAQPPMPVAGDVVTYNLIIGNDGLVPAVNVSLLDTLPTGLTYVPGSTLVLSPGYTLAEPTVSGQMISWSLAGSNAITGTSLPAGTLPASSGDIFIQYQATVDPGTPPGTALQNVVTIATDTPEDDTTNNEDDKEVNAPYPDPAVIKIGPEFVEPGARFSWTLTYWNNTRQFASNVYLIDTLPDATADGETDVTFVSQTAPAGVTAYYHAGVTTSVPTFDPLDPSAGGWSATPTTPVNHIAWLIGALPGESELFNITVTTDAIRPNGGSPIPLAAATALTNVATIVIPDTDANPANNSDDHTTRTPGNDITLTKSGSSEGTFPGIQPGGLITYTLNAANTGTQTAFGIEVIDTLPAGVTLTSPSFGPAVLSLVDDNGDPVQPVDILGNPISGEIPISISSSGNQVTFLFGSAVDTDPLYYRNIGLRPGQRQPLTVHVTVNQNVTNGTVITNTATAILHNHLDTDPPEIFTGNNTDDSSTIVFRPDLTVRKSVKDVTTNSTQWTEAGSILKYTLDYQNLGYGPALDSVISEIVPAGTTLQSVNNPPGSTVTYYPGPSATGATAFDVNLGTLNAPANLVGVLGNSCFQTLVTKLANGENGIPAGTFASSAGSAAISLGELGGAPAIFLGASTLNSSTGGGWVVRLNPDGSALSVTKLANGENGIPTTGQPNAFAGQAGYSAASLGELNGAPAILLGASGLNGEGGGYVVRLNPDGSALSVTRLGNGENGIPAGMFASSSLAGHSVASMGTLDGAPAILLGAWNMDSAAGGVYVVRLNLNGSALSVTKLANGENGIPVGMFEGFAGESLASLGELDGSPTIVMGARNLNATRGGCYVVKLNPDGSALAVTRLNNGENGIPATGLPNSFAGRAGISVASLGELDGAPAIVLGAYSLGSTSGGGYVLRLNPDGTALSVARLANGENGIPAGAFANSSSTGWTVSFMGDVAGAPAILFSASGLNTNTGGCFVIRLNLDGTAVSVTKFANGASGVGAGVFAGQAGLVTTSLGNMDGAPSILLGARQLNTNTGGGYIVRLVSEPCDGDPDFGFLDGTNVASGRLDVEIAPLAGTDTVAMLSNTTLPPAWDQFAGQAGYSLASLGELDGAPAVLMGAYQLNSGMGGAYVVRLNPDGSPLTVTKLANGENGIPAGMFDGWAGRSVASLGELDGAPAILLGAQNLDTNRGGAYVVRLNPDGSALSVTKFMNGLNGIAAGTFFNSAGAGWSVASLGELNGAPAIMLGANGLNSLSGGGYVIRLNANGSAALSVTRLNNGSNGIPAGMFTGRAGVSAVSLGNLNGAPAVLLGASFLNSSTGGGYVLRLNPDGSALSVTKLANGENGVPAGMFAGSAGESAAFLGEVGGAPAILLGVTQLDSNRGGAFVVRLNPDGSALSVTKLINGQSGIPAGMFANFTGWSVASLGVLEGTPTIVLGAYQLSSFTGGGFVVRLNPDGSAFAVTRISNGVNGVPAGAFAGGSGSSATSLGILNGSPAFMLGAPSMNTSTGGGHVVRITMGKLYETGSIEVPLDANYGLLAWGRLFSEADIPDGTSLSYTIGRRVNGVPIYDLGSGFTNIPGPLPAVGFDLSSLNHQSLVAKVDFATTQPREPGALTPTLHNLIANYQSSVWPQFTFTVRVDDPVPTHVLPDINNTVTIATATPELDDSNNSDSDDINVRLADLAVVKSTDKAAALESETVTFTLDWQNNGPQDAINAVLTDTLPAGLTFVSATPVPTSASGQLLTWNLGDLAPAASGSVLITATVNSGTAGQTLVNTTSITNNRQETDYTNNQDEVPVLIGSLANVWITKEGVNTATLGGTATFTLTYGNNGNNAAANVVLTDVLPAGLSFASASPAETSVSGQTITWNFGTLAPGTSGSITVTANVGTDFIALHNQTLVNTTAITTTTIEVSLADNSDSHPVTTLGAPAAIGGFVWHDLNKDGVIDPGESPLANVLITLTGTDVFGDPVITTQSTGPDGSYTFSGLLPGTYQIAETQPTGYLSTMDVLGTVEGNPNGTNTNPLDDLLTSITLQSGDRGINYNFGNLSASVSIGSFIWDDANNNGLQDSGEPGLAGALVSLLVNDGLGNFIPATNLAATPVAAQTTGSSGTYYFSNLPPGDYRIQVIPPATYLPAAVQTSADNNNTENDSNIAGPGPVAGSFISGTFTLAPGTSPVESGSKVGDNLDGSANTNGNMTADFGFYTPGSLGNFVWRDTNGNGLQDSGEVGIAGVTVNLLEGSGNPVLNGGGVPITTSTDSDGAYSFTNLAPGNYSVEFIAPSGNTFSPQNADSAGTNGAVNSDVNPITGRTDVVTLASGENNVNLDAGLYQPASLGSFVWRDTNGNGLQDSSELGIAGVVINLLDGNGNPVLNSSGVPITTTTDADGLYGFGGLVPGTYSVRFVAPAGNAFSPQDADSIGLNGPANSDANPTTGITASVTLVSGDNNPNLDAGLYQPASLGSFVWRDTNGNGLQDVGELGIAGVVVNLLDGSGNPVLDGNSVPITTTTDSDGAYSFTGLAPGSYGVEFIAPAGNTFSPPNADSTGLNGALNSDANPTTGRTASVTLASGDNNPNLDAGLYQTSSLGSFVWLDSNGNGLQDVGEPGIAGVVINLLDGTGNPVLDGNSLPLTTTTDSDGAYSFTNLTPGSYSVEFIAPSGNTFSPLNTDSAGLNGPVNSDANPTTGRTAAVTLASGEQNPNLDAGLYQPTSLGNFVWVDTQNFGIQDLGELGMAGVVVNLLDGSGNPVLDGGGTPISTPTDSTGFYSFTNLAPGSYSVQFIAPNDYLISPQNADSQGLNGPVNSDADPTTGRTAAVTLASGETHLNLDAGLYQPARIIGTVKDDTTGDKLGDTPLSGVTLTLLDAAGNAVTTTTTNALGEYAFTSLLPGTYSVVETDPTGYLSLTPNTVASITLPPNGTGEAHFVDTLPVSITGTVTWDTNGDGTGDTVVPGAVLLLLDQDGNPVLDQAKNPVTTTTDANGDYAFTDLPPGQYTVVHELEDGFAALTPSTVELDPLLPGTSAEAHFVITQTEDTSRIVYCYCLTTVDINPLRNVPPHHSGAWEVVSATSVNGFGRIRILSDGYIRYLPNEDFLGDVTDTIVVVLRAPDGTTLTRRIVVNSFDSISGKFQSLLAIEDTQNNGTTPSADPDYASMRGLINLNLSGSAVVSGKVRLEGETISFRGPIRGAVSFVKANSRHGKNRWDISVIYSDKTDSWDIRLTKQGGETFVGTGIRALKTSPALAGRYSTVFGDSVLGQSDFGSGRVVIGRKATVRLIGKLDGAQRSFTTSATILQNQQIPFFQRSSIGGSYRRISIGGVLFIDATNATGWFEGNGWIKLDPTATTGLATPDPRIPHDLWFQPQP